MQEKGGFGMKTLNFSYFFLCIFVSFCVYTFYFFQNERTYVHFHLHFSFFFVTRNCFYLLWIDMSKEKVLDEALKSIEKQFGK